MECKFSNVTHEMEVKVKIDAQVIPKRGSSKYLGSMIHGYKEIDDDVAHSIRAWWAL